MDFAPSASDERRTTWTASFREKGRFDFACEFRRSDPPKAKRSFCQVGTRESWRAEAVEDFRAFAVLALARVIDMF